jgi:hypothetical protein
VCKQRGKRDERRLMSLLPDAVDLTPIFPWIGERTMNDP